MVATIVTIWSGSTPDRLIFDWISSSVIQLNGCRLVVTDCGARSGRWTRPAIEGTVAKIRNHQHVALRHLVNLLVPESTQPGALADVPSAFVDWRTRRSPPNYVAVTDSDRTTKMLRGCRVRHRAGILKTSGPVGQDNSAADQVHSAASTMDRTNVARRSPARRAPSTSPNKSSSRVWNSTASSIPVVRLKVCSVAAVRSPGIG